MSIFLPAWIKPIWAERPVPQYEEYFNTDGELVGSIQPFGDKWLAAKFDGVIDNGVSLKPVGVYINRDLAKRAIEKLP